MHNGQSAATNQLAFLMQQMRSEWKGRLSAENADSFAERAGLVRMYDNAAVREEAKCIASGMILAALAHEVGHLTLGHLYGPRYGEQNPEISRNGERQADLFASSVISASPFGQYMFEGALLSHLVCAALDGAEESYSSRTHPYSRERLVNFMQQNKAKLSALKLAAEDIISMIPPLHGTAGEGQKTS